MFTEKDLSHLTEIFTMARMNTVQTQPANRQLLENVMNFEVILKSKMLDANKALTPQGESIPEAEKPNAPVETAVAEIKSEEKEEVKA